jgi:lipoate-protein ligase A
MRLLNLTLGDPASNLALDEALMLEAESGDPCPVLRIWEPDQELVVVGRGSQVMQEVQSEMCARQGVPILRRCSGGAAIVTGPGCLMYALVMRSAGHAELANVDGIHRFVLQTMATALSTPAAPVVPLGISDLAVEPTQRKFSGNSLRLRRHGQSQATVLYHGTILYDFSLPRIQTLLRRPPRVPAYRKERTHADFLANLPMSREEIRQRVAQAWAAEAGDGEWPEARTRQLVAERYRLDAWNLRH